MKITDVEVIHFRTVSRRRVGTSLLYTSDAADDS